VNCTVEILPVNSHFGKPKFCKKGVADMSARLSFPEPAPKPNPDLSEIKRQVSRVNAACNQLAVAAKMPPKFRAYLDALLACANGREKFEATNNEIATQVIQTREMKPESAGRCVTRYASLFFKWQDGVGLALVRRRVGYKDRETGEHVKSEYELPALPIIAGILERGGWNSLSLADKDQALERLRGEAEYASAAIRENQYAQFKIPQPTQTFPNGKPPAQRGADIYQKQALSWARKIGEVCAPAETANRLRDLATAILELANRGTNCPPAEVVHTRSSKDKGTNFSLADEIEEDPLEAAGGTVAALNALTRNATVALGPAVISAETAIASAAATPPAASNPLPETEVACAVEALVAAGVERFQVDLVRDNALVGKVCVQHAVVAAADVVVLVQKANAEGLSCCVRPISNSLIQLDDISPEALSVVAPYACLIIETSEQGRQAWVCVNGDRQSIRRRLIVALGADGSASGSMRFPGSYNWKYARAPLVRVLKANPCVFTEEELVSVGIIQPEAAKPDALLMSPAVKMPRAFPSYEQALFGAPVNNQGDRVGKPKRSRADFFWSLLALRWGWSVAEVVSELLSVSENAAGRGRRYAEETVGNAAKKV
jgi:hypothetical protein